jgi:hypothetical protein
MVSHCEELGNKLCNFIICGCQAFHFWQFHILVFFILQDRSSCIVCSFAFGFWLFVPLLLLDNLYIDC